MLTTLIVTWLVTAVSLFLLSRVDLGIEIEDFSTSLIAALAIGLINAFLRPIAQVLAFPITFLTLGLFALVVNALLFWLAAELVKGFSLRNGFWSALIGSLLLGLLNGVIFAVLRAVGVGA
jgi:putative membrane protein